jgi:hypothetical protein
VQSDVRFVPKCDIAAPSLRQRICLVLIAEPPAERADFRKINGSGCALGGYTLRKKVKIGFLAPSAFVEGIERWATR